MRRIWSFSLVVEKASHWSQHGSRSASRHQSVLL